MTSTDRTVLLTITSLLALGAALYAWARLAERVPACEDLAANYVSRLWAGDWCCAEDAAYDEPRYA